MFSEWIRRVSFWGLDFVTGSKLRQHYLEIKNIMENSQAVAVSTLQAQHLSQILKYAAENVEFYRPYVSADSITAFPVINKNIIKDHYEAFQSREFRGRDVVIMHTSGSTGTPFAIRQDKVKRNRVLAEMIYFWGKAGYQIGMRYAFFRIWASSNQRSRLSVWTRNLMMYDVEKLDDGKLEEMRNIVRFQRNIKMLVGYPSTLANLANHLLACGDVPEINNLKVILAIGEALHKNTWEKLRMVYDCNVISVYSNQENGTLAIKCVENKEFHINNASYYIELLKLDADEPAGVGELGRIVVTDLFNHAMPLIRYDTGDTAMWKESAECGWQSPSFASVQGRLLDYIFDTQGNKISPFAINGVMWPFEKVLQFQFIQKGPKQFALKLNGAEGIYDPARVADSFKELLGADAEICVENVKEIPVLESGKRKNVVNEWMLERHD